jgi:pyruvate dehydrogenase E1 component alpha subunit
LANTTTRKPKASSEKNMIDPNGYGYSMAVNHDGSDTYDGSDTFDPIAAQAEYDKRKGAQLIEIKKTDPQFLKDMLYQMALGRVFEQKCAEVYRLGKIGGFCHLYIGQEAIGIGTQMALRETDYVISSYRDHVQAMVQGIEPEAVMAELYGKAGGNVGGKGGSMHMFSKEKNFFGGHGIVGGQIGIATGMAYAQKYRDEDNVTVCYFGEAAVNQGMFHESLNMAQLWKLPVIYICENNRYGMGTSQKRAMSTRNIAKKAEGFGMANEFVDGMDVLAVRNAVLRATERARTDSSPTLLEMRAYRYMGHSMSDPGKYRTAEEIKKFRTRDPLKLFRESLTEAGVIDDKEYEEIEARAAAKTADAVDFAEKSPFPDESKLFTGIYK